jgi:hypothetical protein
MNLPSCPTETELSSDLNSDSVDGKSKGALKNLKSSYRDLSVDTSETITDFKPTCELKRYSKSKQMHPILRMPWTSFCEV